MRALILHSNVDDARQRKVAGQLARAGWDLVRCGFRRDYYRSDHDIPQVHVLGTVEHSATAGRLPSLIRSAGHVRQLAAGCQVGYCFGADMHLLGVVATIGRTVPLFRDVADLPRLLSSTNAKAALARKFDAWSARRAAGLVVTSEAFYDDYYRPMLGSGAPRCFVLANNVDPEVTGPRIAAPIYSQDRPLRIGYFGLIRCERSLEILAAVARLAPEGVKVLVRGHNLIGFDLDQLAADLPNFEVGSQYRSPEDLASVYAACDVVWSCYPYEPANINWRLAKTNRFYEACYFRRPQICQTGTKDAKKVIELGIGISVDLADVAGSAAAIAAITRNQLAYMADRLEQLPADVYTYSGEAGEIAAFAKRVVTIPR